VITDPEKRFAPPLAHLRQLCGLTPAEPRLAMALAHGEDLKAAASELATAYTTARTQLASIFRKTRTERRSQLVRLLLQREWPMEEGFAFPGNCLGG